MALLIYVSRRSVPSILNLHTTIRVYAIVQGISASSSLKGIADKGGLIQVVLIYKTKVTRMIPVKASRDPMFKQG